MHPRERSLAASTPATRCASRCRPPSPITRDGARGAFPGRVQSLTSSSLSRHRQHRVCPAAALLRRVDRLAPTHTAVLTSKTELRIRWWLRPFVSRADASIRAVPERSRALGSKSRVKVHTRLRSRTPARRFLQIERPHDRLHVPGGPHSACDAVRGAIVMELPVLESQTAADAYDRIVPISRWNGQPACRAVPEERALPRVKAATIEPGRTAIHVAVRASADTFVRCSGVSSREGELRLHLWRPVVPAV